MIPGQKLARTAAACCYRLQIPCHHNHGPEFGSFTHPLNPLDIVSAAPYAGYEKHASACVAQYEAEFRLTENWNDRENDRSNCCRCLIDQRGLNPVWQLQSNYIPAANPTLLQRPGKYESPFSQFSERDLRRTDIRVDIKRRVGEPLGSIA